MDLTNIDEVKKEIAAARAVKKSAKSRVTNHTNLAKDCITTYIKKNSDGTESVDCDAGGPVLIQQYIDQLHSKAEDVTEVIEWLKELESKFTELSLAENDSTRHKVVEDLDAEGQKESAKCAQMGIQLASALAKLQGKSSSAPTSKQTVATACPDKQIAWKPHAHFRPAVLQSDMSPDELDEWAQKFEAWIPQADAKSQGISNINLLLEEVLSPTVQALIGFSTRGETPIYSDGSGQSIMDKLQASWLVRYPVLKRRQEFFQPKDSENFSQMSMQILKRARKADLDNMLTKEDIIAHIFLTNLYAGGAKYKKILDKILHSSEFKDGHITVNDITAIANAEETVDHLLKPANTNETPDPDWIGKIQPGRSQTRRKTLNPKLEAFKQQGLCFNCAEKQHKSKNDCPAKGKTCKNCGKNNHFAAACCSEKKETKKE